MESDGSPWHAMLAASTRYLRTDEVNELDDLGSSSHGKLQIAAERMSIPFGHPQPNLRLLRLAVAPKAT
jgi:hypothetical protein